MAKIAFNKIFPDDINNKISNEIIMDDMMKINTKLKKIHIELKNRFDHAILWLND